MFKSYFEVRDWLESHIPLVYGREELGLKRIENLLKILGNPQTKFKSVHVAGTSGKGTTANYIARLTETGYKRPVKVGLHTSPHLIDIRERMTIGGKLMPLNRFLKLFGEIKLVVEKISADLKPSYFEILVAASFKYFAEEKVDFAVVEVGLGGRLDATNVLMPEVCVITNVGLDHTEILGNTIEKIAFEKAGIIKNKIPVVCGASKKALKVIADVARKQQAPLIKVNTQKVPRGLLEEPFWQSRILAKKAVELLFGAVPVERSQMLEFAGRVEEIENGVILDGAHNPDKIKFLVNVCKLKMKNKKTKVILVTGFKKGKNWKRMVDILLKNLPVGGVIATEYQAVADTGFGSSVVPEELRNYIEGKYRMSVRTIGCSQEAVWEAVKDQGPDENALVIVTGSLYLVGESRTLWKLPEF